MPTIIPATGARYFSKGFNDGKAAPAFQYIFDSGVVWQGDNGLINTGAMRPVIPSDLAGVSNVSVSGLSLSVGAVALTGTSVVTTTGNQPVSVVNTSPIPISGVVQSTAPAIQAVSGIVNVLGGNTLPLNVTGIILTQVTGAVSASFDSTAIVNAQATGNQRLLVADQLLSGISGQLAGPLTTTATIANSILAISGVVTTSATIGNVAITGFTSTIAPLAVSGVFNATTDNTSVILAIATGNARELVNNALLSGVSGLLASNLTDPAYVTGQVGITNSILAISGIVQSSAAALQAVSGNVTIVNTAPIPFSGVTQSNITNALLTAQITGFNSGIVITTDVRSSSTAGNSTPSGTSPYTSMSAFSFGQALAANPNRIELFIQNLSTGVPLYISLGSTPASTGAFSMILNPSTVQGWAGTSWGSRSWRGAVQASGNGWIAWDI